jgi:ubiquinone/menaquinone biosynthesis C-methylase UbiE
MGWWTEHVVPRVTDRALDADEVHDWRARACAGLRGRVLEVGFGSGLNLRHYPSEVTAVEAVEPSEVAWGLARSRMAEAAMPVRRTGLDGERLAAASERYDAVLSTFTLCTIPDPSAALAEIHRVLRPGGRLHFLEHGRSPDPAVFRWQHRLEPVQRRVMGGCHLTRDAAALVRLAGLDLRELENGYLPGPRASHPFGYLYLGSAVK